MSYAQVAQHHKEQKEKLGVKDTQVNEQATPVNGKQVATNNVNSTITRVQADQHQREFRESRGEKCSL